MNLPSITPTSPVTLDGKAHATLTWTTRANCSDAQRELIIHLVGCRYAVRLWSGADYVTNWTNDDVMSALTEAANNGTLPSKLIQ